MLLATLFSTRLSLAETICSAGPRGVLRAPCTDFSSTRRAFRFTGGQARRFVSLGTSTPNLLAQNGNLFEVSAFGGQPRQLMVDLRPGRQGIILGASSLDTIRQVIDHLSRIGSQLTGGACQIAITVLTRHGRNANGLCSVNGGPVAQNPGPSGPRPTSPSGGDHGQGGESDGASRRPAFDLDRLLDSTGRAVPQVCRNLHDSICGGTNRQSDKQADEAKANDVLRRFREGTCLSVNAFGAVMQGILDTQPSRQSVFPGFGVRGCNGEVKSARTIFNDLMKFLTDGRVQELPSVQRIRDTMGEVKTSLLAAIDKMEFSDPGAKNAMKNKIAATELKFTPDLTSFRQIKEFVEGCGPDGMTVSAFALPDTNQMMICPGLFLTAATKGDQLIDTLIHVAAHEWGHNLHIPTQKLAKDKQPFLRMENCFTSEFAKDGFLPKQVEEAVADTIGAAALAERVKDKSAAETLRILRSSTNILCFTTGRDRNGQPDEHPPGEFRINKIVGRNPTIMERLGCGQPTATEPVCLVQGRVPL